MTDNDFIGPERKPVFPDVGPRSKQNWPHCPRCRIELALADYQNGETEWNCEECGYPNHD